MSQKRQTITNFSIQNMLRFMGRNILQAELVPFIYFSSFFSLCKYDVLLLISLPFISPTFKFFLFILSDFFTPHLFSFQTARRTCGNSKLRQFLALIVPENFCFLTTILCLGHLKCLSFISCGITENNWCCSSPLSFCIALFSLLYSL